MDGSKTTYIMPDGNNDNLATMALMNNGGFGGNGMWNNPFIYLVWMAMFNGGFFGNRNGNLQADAATLRQILTVLETLQDNHNSDLIMQGIQGNAESVRLAADRMGLNYNALQMAVNNVANAVGLVESATGFSAERVINAINSGDANLSQALCQAACNLRSDITNQGYQNLLANLALTNTLQNSIFLAQNAMVNGFTNLGFLNQQQSCSLETTIRDTGNSNTQSILGKLDLMLTQALQDKIDSLQAKVSELAVTINNGVLSAMFSQMLTQAVAPINLAISNLNTELYDVKCKLPNTVTLPYSSATAVPTALATYYNQGNNGYWG